MKKVLLCLALFVLLGCDKKMETNVVSISWIEDEPEVAFQKAKEEKKPLLIEFSADWCIYCGIIESTTLHDPQIVNLSEKFVSLRIDVDKPQNRSIVRQFQEKGIPLFVTTNDEGKELSRVVDPSVDVLKSLMVATLAAGEMPEVEKDFYKGLKANGEQETTLTSELYKKVLPHFEKNPGWELASILYFQLSEEGSLEGGDKFLRLFPEHPWKPLILNEMVSKSETSAAKAYYARLAWETIDAYFDSAREENPNYRSSELEYTSIKPELAEHIPGKNKEEECGAMAGWVEKKARRSNRLFSKPYWMKAIELNVCAKNFRRAIWISEKMVKDYPDEDTFYGYLGWIFGEAGQWGKAIFSQQKALTLAEETRKPRRIVGLSDAMAGSGDLEGGISLLETFLKESSNKAESIRRESVYVGQAQSRIKEWKRLLPVSN